jgi:Transcriptional regulator DsbA
MKVTYMTIIQTDAFVVPSDPATLKKIQDVCFELSASFTRQEGERDFQKEAIAELSEVTDIPKKHISKIAKLYHKSNKDAVEAEQASTNELYDRIFVKQE